VLLRSPSSRRGWRLLKERKRGIKSYSMSFYGSLELEETTESNGDLRADTLSDVRSVLPYQSQRPLQKSGFRFVWGRRRGLGTRSTECIGAGRRESTTLGGMLTKTIAVVVLIAALAGCGGSSGGDRGRVENVAKVQWHAGSASCRKAGDVVVAGKVATGYRCTLETARIPPSEQTAADFGSPTQHRCFLDADGRVVDVTTTGRRSACR
jgi:hypothetical protein